MSMLEKSALEPLGVDQLFTSCLFSVLTMNKSNYKKSGSNREKSVSLTREKPLVLNFVAVKLCRTCLLRLHSNIPLGQLFWSKSKCYQ